MRIALIHISQETNDFNPQLTTLADFKAFGLYEGEEIVRLGTIGQIGGHFEAIKRSGVQVQTIPIIRGFAVAGGRIDSESRSVLPRPHSRGPEGCGQDRWPRTSAAWRLLGRGR